MTAPRPNPPAGMAVRLTAALGAIATPDSAVFLPDVLIWPGHEGVYMHQRADGWHIVRVTLAPHHEVFVPCMRRHFEVVEVQPWD